MMKPNIINRTSDPLVIQKATLNRLPLYYCFLQKVVESGEPSEYIASTFIANNMRLSPIQVRKDLASVSSEPGKPKMGFRIEQLMSDIEEYLGFNNVSEAVLVGVGRLGRTLLAYEGFQNYGLKIAAGFDNDETLAGLTINNKPVFGMNKLGSLVKRLQINIGIITVPAAYSQDVCDQLVDAGVKAIWNFAPTLVSVPNGIIVRNENLAASLAKLSKELVHSMHNNK